MSHLCWHGGRDPSGGSLRQLHSGDGYRESALLKKEGVALDLMQVGSPYQVGLASWNAADDAARRIRSDAKLNVVICVVGLGSATEPRDEVLLHRVANMPMADNKTFESSRPAGLVVVAPSPAGLKAAFREVRAAIQQAVTPR